MPTNYLTFQQIRQDLNNSLAPIEIALKEPRVAGDKVKLAALERFIMELLKNPPKKTLDALKGKLKKTKALEAEVTIRELSKRISNPISGQIEISTVAFPKKIALSELKDPKAKTVESADENGIIRTTDGNYSFMSPLFIALDDKNDFKQKAEEYIANIETKKQNAAKKIITNMKIFVAKQKLKRLKEAHDAEQAQLAIVPAFVGPRLPNGNISFNQIKNIFTGPLKFTFATPSIVVSIPSEVITKFLLLRAYLFGVKLPSSIGMLAHKNPALAIQVANQAEIDHAKIAIADKADAHIKSLEGIKLSFENKVAQAFEDEEAKAKAENKSKVYADSLEGMFKKHQDSIDKLFDESIKATAKANQEKKENDAAKKIQSAMKIFVAKQKLQALKKEKADADKDTKCFTRKLIIGGTVVGVVLIISGGVAALYFMAPGVFNTAAIFVASNATVAAASLATFYNMVVQTSMSLISNGQINLVAPFLARMQIFGYNILNILNIEVTAKTATTIGATVTTVASTVTAYGCYKLARALSIGSANSNNTKTDDEGHKPSSPNM